MLRTFFVAVVALADTLVFAPSVIAVSLWRADSRLIDSLIRNWARLLVRAAGIDLRVEHAERLDPDVPCIIIANHASYFDIPCLQAVIPHRIRFMAKKSLFQIPIFGWSLKAAGFIPVDRKNRSTAVRSFDLAAEQIRKGYSIIVFPEEGRSRTREMRPFQRGAFLLAIRARLPIVPVAITGTYDLMPATRWSIHPGPVRLTIGDAINPSEFGVRQREQLAQHTKDIILTMKQEAEEAIALSGPATDSLELQDPLS